MSGFFIETRLPANAVCSFWGIFCVDCSSEAAIRDSVARIAEVCSLQDKHVDTVRGYPANLRKPWLLILDNCDDPWRDYSSLFPSARGSVLMTTRNDQTPNLYGESESLDELAGEDAITLFLKACVISEADFQGRREVATKVADLLGQHALALVQAGIYVSSGLCSLEEFPTFFKSNHNDILKYSKVQMQSRYSNVWTTLEASMETLQTSEDEVEILAVNLFARS